MKDARYIHQNKVGFVRQTKQNSKRKKRIGMCAGISNSIYYEYMF